MASILHEPMNRRRFIAGSLRTAALLTAIQSSWSPFTGNALAGDLIGDHFEADPDDLRSLLKTASRGGGELAEIFIEQTYNRDFRMINDRLTEASFEIDEGCGVRVINDRCTGYAFADGFARSDVKDAAQHARRITRNASSKLRTQPLPQKPGVRYGVFHSLKHLNQIDDPERIKVMRRAITTARQTSNLIENIDVSYTDQMRRILIVNSNGLFRMDQQPLIMVAVNVSASDGRARHQGNRRLSMRSGFELFDGDGVERIAAEAAEEAVQMLSATDFPPGATTVILARGAGGVIFHEAVGHGLEGDAIVENRSNYCGRMGEKIGSSLITLVDDGSLVGGRGSAHYDDEGSETQRTVLIDRGVLKTYLTDVTSARLLGLPLTGNARRESYRSPPLVRMTNTLLDPGSDDPEAILADTDEGLYCKSFNGGMVDTASGHFTFYVREAYEIRGGRITRPIHGATLTGKGSELLNRIDRVGNDFDTFPATCGKGQWVPVSSGQPTIRVSQMIVGGSKTR